MPSARRAFCWTHTWNEDPARPGLEHLLLRDNTADGALIACGDEGAFRVAYRVTWDERHHCREVDLVVVDAQQTRRWGLRSDGKGNWWHAAGTPVAELAGCIDIDIWPTPFTNSLPIWRLPMNVGERREIRVAWIDAPALAVTPQRQAYTRLAERLYRFESLDSGFVAELPVDQHGVVLDYPQLFARLP